MWRRKGNIEQVDHPASVQNPKERATHLRAGVSSTVVPHLADQALWGKRVEMLGVGTKSFPRDKLPVSALTRAIQSACYGLAMKKHAAELAEKTCAEDGLSNAVSLIEGSLRNPELG